MKAKEEWKDADDTFVLENYNDFAVCIGDDILVNSGIYIKALGLHLITHEIMHSLANSDAVKQLRKEDMGDEAINEFFARIATYIYRNNGGKSAGLTAFEELEGINEYYDKELGLYGVLIKKESHLSDLLNEKCSYENPEYVKELAAFYFKGESIGG